MERSRGKGEKAVPLTAPAETARKTAKVPAKCPRRNGSCLKFDFLNKTRYTQYNNKITPSQKPKLTRILPVRFRRYAAGKSVCFHLEE
jgi:hypothetical protein